MLEGRAMIRARCLDCGEVFQREADEGWKKRCFSCWLKTKSAAPDPDPCCWEFRENLRELIVLAHPDKHGGSALSTRMTQWLLSVRQRVAERVS
jgi:hypothetical protein